YVANSTRTPTGCPISVWMQLNRICGPDNSGLARVFPTFPSPLIGGIFAAGDDVRLRCSAVALSVLLLQGCAGALGNLSALVQPPRFQQVPGRQAEIRVLGLDGAGVGVWTRG